MWMNPSSINVIFGKSAFQNFPIVIAPAIMFLPKYSHFEYVDQRKNVHKFSLWSAGTFEKLTPSNLDDDNR